MSNHYERAFIDQTKFAVLIAAPQPREFFIRFPRPLRDVRLSRRESPPGTLIGHRVTSLEVGAAASASVVLASAFTGTLAELDTLCSHTGNHFPDVAISGDVSFAGDAHVDGDLTVDGTFPGE